MKTGNSQPHSHLFTLRIWGEALDGEHAEWRGKVQHVVSGEIRYLRDWNDLLPVLLAMVQDDERRQGANLSEEALPDGDRVRGE